MRKHVLFFSFGLCVLVSAIALALFGGPATTGRVVENEVAGVAGTNGCSGGPLELADQVSKERFESAKEILLESPLRVTYPSAGKKVSEGVFRVVDPRERMFTVSVTCTLTCSGQECSLNGCDAQPWGCTSFDCTGEGCLGRCKGKSVE